MAANEYYNTATPNNHVAHQHLDHTPPSPPPSLGNPPPSLYTNSPPARASYLQSRYSASGASDSLHDNPYHSRDSYYSGDVGGTLNDDRQYADNIPLKSPESRPYSEGPLAGQTTQYPPSPESQRPPRSSRRRKKKQGWFSGQITWVVFAATLVQIGAFIAEIAVNGRVHASSGALSH